MSRGFSRIPGQSASAALLGSLLESETTSRNWLLLSSSPIPPRHLFWSLVPFFSSYAHLISPPPHLSFPSTRFCSAFQPAGRCSPNNLSLTRGRRNKKMEELNNSFCCDRKGKGEAWPMTSACSSEKLDWPCSYSEVSVERGVDN